MRIVLAYDPPAGKLGALVMKFFGKAPVEQVDADLGRLKALIEAGFRHYDDMCEGCHGAPGKDQSAAAEGMRPEPPELYHGLEDTSPAELFWVVKHGIKMTGMPAWGVTHSDDELWDLVAFLRHLPELDAATYAALEAELGGGHHGGAGGHVHGSSPEGTPEADHPPGDDHRGP